MKIDLTELFKRESESVEWKENIGNIEDVIKTIVAFANDFSNLGGGYVVCGAREGKDEYGFQKLLKEGLSSGRLKEIEGKVLHDCREKVNPPIVPLTEEIEVSETKRILVLIVPATGNAHSYKPSGKNSETYFIRIGRETREATNGLLKELLVKKQQLAPWDKRTNKNGKIEDLDLVLFRDFLQETKLLFPNKQIEEYLSDKETLTDFIPPLLEKENLSDKLFPKNFTLIMFAKNPLIFFAGAYTIFSIYRGKDRSEPTAEKHEIKGTILQQAKKLIELLNAEAYTIFDKTTSEPNQVKYPGRALQEAVVNTLVHRDYESEQPARVTVFSDRIEFFSPGALPRAVDEKKFENGKATAHWRNQTLAYFFNKLQLAQAEGQGIPTILRLMKEAGCPEPIFDLGKESVTCILPAHPRHKIMRELQEIDNKIILQKYDEAFYLLEEILKQDFYNFRALDLFCDLNNLLRTQEKVYDFLVKNNVLLTKINSKTLLKISDTLSPVLKNEQQKQFLNDLLSIAVASHLEEKEIIRVAINLKRIGKNEEVIDFIDNSIKQYPFLASNPSLLEEKARAKIDLAKKCRETAKNYKTTKQRRNNAWEKFKNYLEDAEKDLKQALIYASSFQKDYIQEDLKFLKTMLKNNHNQNNK
ncbi:putative DNA binding domain-containing protein [bacterium]|nr:putative DNA binding domain-containing protein [bacterium]